MRVESYEMALKRQFFTERLNNAGVTHSRNGQLLHELAYEDLKREWVLLQYREIDVDNSENSWF